MKRMLLMIEMLLHVVLVNAQYPAALPSSGTISLQQISNWMLAAGEIGGNNYSITYLNSHSHLADKTLPYSLSDWYGYAQLCVPSVAPTGISYTNNYICAGTSNTLSVVGGSLGTGATWQWYSGSCGGTYLGAGPSINVTYSATGPAMQYYVRASGTCNVTACAMQYIWPGVPPTAPTGISGNTSIPVGGSTTLTIIGGSLGSSSSQWRWSEGGTCSGYDAGTGTSITVSPSTTTTYSVRASTLCGYSACVSITVTVGSVTTATGRVWMDRNLGASRVATSNSDVASCGDLYQWGRPNDGHQVKTSGTTYTLSSNDVPGHGNFIVTPNAPIDWRSPQNVNLWQGVNGVNNPCPGGFRLPTSAEWEAERVTWSSFNLTGAFASPLKLPAAGNRGWIDAGVFPEGIIGNYWSSTVNGTNSQYLYFNGGTAVMTYNYRGYGFSVRCIKN